MHGAFGQRLKDLESISLPSEFTWEPHNDDDPKKHLCFQKFYELHEFSRCFFGCPIKNKKHTA